MYIMIAEDGEMVLLKEIDKGTLQAADDGYITLIDVSTADDPLLYFDEGWTNIDMFDQPQ